MGLCRKNRKRLNAYIDGELSEWTHRSVERHLAGCTSCRKISDRLRQIESFLHSLDPPPVPAALTARILSEASSRRGRKFKPSVKPGRRTLLPQPWFVTSATTAALFVGVALGAWMGLNSYGAGYVGSDQVTTIEMKSKGAEKNLYAIDVLGAEPRGSIEAATLALMENR